MVSLTTSRLILREAEASDVDALAKYQSDHRYLEHYNEQPNAHTIVQQARNWADELPRQNYQLIVFLETTSTVIGCAGIRCNGYPEREGELGIELSPDYWGKGLAAEATKALTSFAAELGLTKLYAVTKSTNDKAQKLIESAGFHRSGMKEDAVVYSKKLASSD